MKALFTALLFFIPFFIYAQEEESTERKTVMAITYSADYSYRSQTGDGSELSESIMALNSQFHKPKYGYTAGVSLFFPMGKRMRLETGLLFANRGEQFVADMENLTFGDMIDPRYGFVYETLEAFPVSSKNKHSYMYVDWPIKLSYPLVEKKLRVSVTAGPSFNTFIAYNSKSKSVYDDGSVKKASSSYNFASVYRVYMAFIGSVTLDYPLNEKLGLRIEPIYRRGITPMNSDRIQSYHYSAGLNFGLTAKLGA
jgi:hypothetical protein